MNVVYVFVYMCVIETIRNEIKYFGKVIPTRKINISVQNLTILNLQSWKHIFYF